MSSNKASLILREAAELEATPYLFSDQELPPIDKTQPKFHCTGERLFRDRRDIYEALVKLLAEPGVSVRTICRELHVSDHTVRSVAGREQIPIATVKKQVLTNITHGLRLASERVIEMMPEASARDALIGVGILGEKMQLLGGDVTQRIDIASSVNLQQEMKNLYDKINERFAAAKQANAIEIVHTRVSGENSSAKALADPAPVFVSKEEVKQLHNTGLERLEAADDGNVTRAGAENAAQKALNGAAAGEAPAAPESPRGEAPAREGAGL